MGNEKIKKAIKDGKLKVNKNGHVCNFTDDHYESLLSGFKRHHSTTCYLCGESIGFELQNNIVEYVTCKYDEGNVMRNIIGRDICNMSNHKKQENPFEIYVPTGNLIIANYFLDKSFVNGESVIKRIFFILFVFFV